jgi:capsule polysaccharide export protein KpsE/RkpR
MGRDRSFELLDYIVLVVKNKKLLLLMAFAVFAISYLFIFFFLPERFESKSLIVPSQGDEFGGISSILQNFSDLPLLGMVGLGGTEAIDLYNTIIYSRTNLEEVIEKFDLQEDYNLDSMEKTILALENDITTDSPNEISFEIAVLASSPQKAAEMVNHLVDNLNRSVIELNIRKSKENRIFLEHRYNEIKVELANAEDSLKIFQQRTGVLEGIEQTKASLEQYSKLEADLAEKQIEAAIFEKLYGENAIQTINSKVAVNEFKQKLESLKQGKDVKSAILPLSELPSGVIQYFRYYRNVMIYEKVLEFILPLYEQAKFEEQKSIPVLQVIDYGKPPEKKAYPKRILSALIITILVLVFASLFIIIKELFNKTENPKLLYIKKEILKFSKK